VLDPLVVPDNVASSIQFNCYISAGPDFEFEIPRISRGNALLAMDLDKTLNPVPTGNGIVAHGSMDDVKTRSEDRETGVSLAKGESFRPMTDVYNESIKDVRDLARRYTKLRERVLDFSTMSPDLAQFSYFPQYRALQSLFTVRPMPNLNGITQEEKSYLLMSDQFLAFTSQLYAFWSGSIRYKFLPLTQRNLPISYEIYNTLTEGTGMYPFANFGGSVSNTYPSIVQLNCQDAGVEVEMPFYNVYNQCLTSNDNAVKDVKGYSPYNSGSLRTTVSVSDIDLLPKQGEINYLPERVYYAAGDDIMFRYLIAPPCIYRKA